MNLILSRYIDGPKFGHWCSPSLGVELNSEQQNLLFLDCGSGFNRDCPGKSRLKAAPTNH